MIPPQLPGLTDELENLIRRFGLDEVRDQILNAAEPQLLCRAQYPAIFHERYMERLRSRFPEAASFATFAEWDQHLCGTIPLGATRAGGLPDLPPAVQWPQHEGLLLPFIAQINLSTIPRVPELALPQKGWLAFFLAAGMRPPPVVVHYDCPFDQLIRQPRPRPEQIVDDEGTTPWETLFWNS